MKRIIFAGLLVSGAVSFAHAASLPNPFTPFTPPVSFKLPIPLPKLPVALPNPVTVATDVITQIGNVFSADVVSAEALSTAVPALQDGNGAACWTAGTNLASVVKLHPLPISGSALTDLEALRLATAAAEQICSNPACNQVFAELSNGVSQLGVSITVPSLSSLCAKVPHVAMVPVAATTISAPAVVPSAVAAPSTTSPGVVSPNAGGTPSSTPAVGN